VSQYFGAEATSTSALLLSDFDALQNYRSYRTPGLVYHVFDLLYLDGHDLRGLP
jgi:ATP-dependent DNA ligase